MFRNFFLREVRTRYLGSSTGLVWALVHPLLALGVVFDPAHGRANEFAVPPGLSADALVAAARAVARAREPAAVTLSAYDPTYDADHRVRDAALRVLCACSRARA